MIISRSPLRVSFFGGGTDFPEFFLRDGGAVLASAIDKYSYITASPFQSHLFDYSIRLSYRKVELLRSTDEIEHNVYRECLKLCGIERDIELHAVADLPSFTGLGSSSSFTVALLHALHSFKGEFLTPHELAREAIHVERHVLRESVGCQDQVLSAFGGFNLVEFKTEDDFSVTRVAIPPTRLAELEAQLLMVFTGLKRRASEVIAPQLRKIDANRATLRSMRDMVYEAYTLLTSQKPLAAFGEVLHRTWQAKRSLDEGIGNAEIDAIYERGQRAGAIGGKLLGAGGGGFMLFFAPLEARQRVMETFADKHVLTMKLNAPGSQIIFS